MDWADAMRRMKVRANAETPLDARAAREFGAEGIGLCRTEHMFFDADRIMAVREMILADNEARPPRGAAPRSCPCSASDFIETVRDHGGLAGDHPASRSAAARIPAARATPRSRRWQTPSAPTSRRCAARVAELHEFNPMLGHRGVRLAISYPEIAEMQARAIFEAATEVGRRTGAPPIPEVMVPLVAARAEFDIHAPAHRRRRRGRSGQGDRRRTRLSRRHHDRIAARRAVRPATSPDAAEFFSFGTNDLTQTTFGISRDDSARFLGEYTAKGIFKTDPFVSLDTEGVGELVRIAVERGAP